MAWPPPRMSICCSMPTVVIVLLWLAPPLVLAGLWPWLFSTRRIDAAHRNGLAVGAFGATLAVIVLGSSSLMRLAGGQLLWSEPRLPLAIGVASLYALLGGWAACTIWLAFRGRLRGLTAGPRCPSVLRMALASALLIALTALFLVLAPLLLARPSPP